jgi:hypothetical protein
MHWMSSFFYVEAKFKFLEKRIINDGITRDEIFQKFSRVHPVENKKIEEIFEELKVEPVDEKLRKCK